MLVIIFLIFHIFGFFFVDGSFAFEKTSSTVALAGGSTLLVEQLRIGATVSNAFAGVNGPYLVDSDDDGDIDDDDEPNGSALGLSLSNVSLALVLSKAKAPPAPAVATDLRSFTSLKADLESASFVGVDGLEIEVSDFSIAINQGGGTNAGVVSTDVIDFSGANAISVSTGPSTPSVTIDFAGDLLQAEGGVKLNIFGFFFIGFQNRLFQTPLLFFFQNLVNFFN